MLRDIIQQIQLDLIENRGWGTIRAFLVTWGCLTGVGLAIVLLATLTGKINGWAVHFGSYGLMLIPMLIWGIVEIALHWITGGATAASAVFGANQRIESRQPVKELAPKVAYWFASQAATYIHAPVAVMILVPCFNVWAYWGGGITIGVYAYAFVNRWTKRGLTLVVGGIFMSIFIDMLLLNLIPAAQVMWPRHIGPPAPSWLNYWLLLVPWVVALVVGVVYLAKSGALGSSGMRNVVIVAVVAAVLFGGYRLLTSGISFPTISASSASATPAGSPGANAVLDAQNETGVSIGRVGSDGKFRVRVEGTINFGTNEDNGPFGSSWHSGAKYGDQTLRRDLATGCVLLQVGGGPLVGLPELSQSNGWYEASGQPGQEVRAFLNESAGNYQNNSGTFSFFTS